MDGAALADRQAALARPAAPAVRGGVGDVAGLRRRPAGRRGLQRAGGQLTMWRPALVAAAVAGLVVGCSSGDDAVAQGGTFEFVAPGGKTDIYYDPPDHRGRPGPVAGPDLMDPSRTVSVDEFIRSGPA